MLNTNNTTVFSHLEYKLRKTYVKKKTTHKPKINKASWTKTQTSDANLELHPVDGKNPANHLGCFETLLIMGKNYRSLNCWSPDFWTINTTSLNTPQKINGWNLEMMVSNRNLRISFSKGPCSGSMFVLGGWTAPPQTSTRFLENTPFWEPHQLLDHNPAKERGWVKEMCLKNCCV